MPDIWGIAAIITKLALYVGIFTATGTVIAALVFKLAGYRVVAIAFAILGLIGSGASFSLGGANLTGDMTGMTDPDMLGLLWSTSVGTALMYRLIGLGLLVLGLFIGKRGLWLSVSGGVLATWSFIQVSHISTLEAGLLDLLLVLHLLAVGFWVGILMPLKRLASDRKYWAEAASLGHQFGQIAIVVVPILIIAGGYMGYRLVGSFAALFGTGYGQALIIKVILVALLLGLAAANKLRFIPGLHAKDPKAARHLTKSISLEWIIILAVLGVTAVLTSNLTLPT